MAEDEMVELVIVVPCFNERRRLRAEGFRPLLSHPGRASSSSTTARATIRERSSPPSAPSSGRGLCAVPLSVVPALDRYLHEHYALVADVEGSRVYRRLSHGAGRP